MSRKIFRHEIRDHRFGKSGHAAIIGGFLQQNIASADDGIAPFPRTGNEKAARIGWDSGSRKCYKMFKKILDNDDFPSYLFDISTVIPLLGITP